MVLSTMCNPNETKEKSTQVDYHNHHSATLEINQFILSTTKLFLQESSVITLNNGQWYKSKSTMRRGVSYFVVHFIARRWWTIGAINKWNTVVIKLMQYWSSVAIL